MSTSAPRLKLRHLFLQAKTVYNHDHSPQSRSAVARLHSRPTHALQVCQLPAWRHTSDGQSHRCVKWTQHLGCRLASWDSGPHGRWSGALGKWSKHRTVYEVWITERMNWFALLAHSDPLPLNDPPLLLRALEKLVDGWFKICCKFFFTIPAATAGTFPSRS